MGPKFLGIGAQKSGTTWLHKNLARRPDVWLPPPKELHYFDIKIVDRTPAVLKLVSPKKHHADHRRRLRRAARRLGREWSRESFAWSVKYLMRTYTDKWYLSLFEAAGDKIPGEITPGYSTLGTRRVEHVFSLLPDVRLIFIMRNPIERVWSHFVMNEARDRDPLTVSVDEVREFNGGAQSRYRTDYLRTIENWTRYYSPSTMFVGFTEDIGLYPGRFVRSCLQHIGAESKGPLDVIREKVHSRSLGRMPVAVGRMLALANMELIEGLAARFGGYADTWLTIARTLVASSEFEADALEYPFHELEFWTSRTGAEDVGFQSRRLDLFDNGADEGHAG